MKKFLLLAMAGFMMSACSNDDTPAPNPGTQQGKISFEISAVEDINNGATKSPVYSQEAVQHVTDVKVYAFKQTGADFLYVKTYDVTGWTDGMTFKRYVVNDGDMLDPGAYQFLAVGRDNPDMFTLNSLSAATKYQDMQASIAASGNESEIFSGSALSTIVSEGNRVSILMSRQVAGVLGYFKNVPQQYKNVNVKYLRLTVNNSNKAVNLTNGIGMTPASSFRLIDVDLSGQAVQNGVYTGNDLTAQNVVKLPNTQLNGRFFLPVNGISMTLGLYGEDGTPLKEWSVKDAGNQPIFNILPNHFYSLGIKAKNDSTNGGTPTDPGDDDSPIDLMTDQNIAITISPAWTLIHNMVIQ